MRALIVALSIVVVPRALSAAVLLTIGEPSVGPAYDATVVEELEARGESVLDADQLRTAWTEALIIAPDAVRDTAFIELHARFAEARIHFFENDFEGAIDIFTLGLELLEEDPSLLAFHADLAPEFFDGLLTLVRCYDVLERPAESADTLDRVAQLMWAAEPNPDRYPQDFVQEYRRRQGLIPTRAVRVSWAADSCRLRINGFVVSETSGNEVRVPGGSHFVALECADARSHIVRLAPDRSDLRFDPAFDEATRFDNGRAIIVPFDVSPPAMRALGTQVNHLLVDGTVYMTRLAEAPVDDETGWLELSRVDAAGGFRAVRVVVGDTNTNARIHSAVEYLMTGETARGVAVWDPDAGWTEPTGIEVVEPTRSNVPWVLGGGALAAAVVGAVFEFRTSESVADVDTCADGLPVDCAPATLPALRSDARTSRSVANAAWIIAGTLATAGITAAVLNRSRRDPDHAASIQFGALPGGAALSLTWSR